MEHNDAEWDATMELEQHSKHSLTGASRTTGCKLNQVMKMADTAAWRTMIYAE